MTSRMGFLNTPYSGYLHSGVPTVDSELTHVGPGTPCGEYFRRFWHPIATTEELTDLPLPAKILGEELVIFRDGAGRIGVLERHCAHRGTSLEFGQVQERGIRCCYHGWLYDVDGKVLETPGEPPESTLKDRLYHGAYHTHEYKGMIFVYMGPPGTEPPLPVYDSFDLPGRDIAPIRGQIDCNWLQYHENSLDLVHTAFLHTIGEKGEGTFPGMFDQIGQLVWANSPTGVVCAHIRRVGDNLWVRINDSLPPNIMQFPPNIGSIKPGDCNPPDHTIWAVPMDDTNTLVMRARHYSLDEERPRSAIFGQTPERPYEERQRQPGDYDAQTSQRPIAIHALEHLGSTDRGIIMLRNMVMEGIRAVQSGQELAGVHKKEGGILPTYCCDTILLIPQASTAEADAQLMRDVGRRVMEHYFENPPATTGYTAYKGPLP